MNFSYAARKGLLSQVKKMVSNGVDPSMFNNSALKTATYNGKLDVVKFLLGDSRVDPTFKNNYPIRIASEKGFVEVVRLLLNDERVDPCALDNYAIKNACVHNRLEVVKLLLEDGRVDPNAEDDYAYRLACYYGHLDVVKLLLSECSANPNARNGYCIGAASENGHIEIVKLLLQYEDIDPTNRDNKALKLATKNGHTEIVKLLKDKIENKMENKTNSYWVHVYDDSEIDQKIFKFINSDDCSSYHDLKSFLKQNKLPFKSRWIFYFLGKNDKISESEIHDMQHKALDSYGGYIFGEVYFWEVYHNEISQKIEILKEANEEAKVINEKELHDMYIEDGYKRMESVLQDHIENAQYNAMREYDRGLLENSTERFEEPKYCSACQESPCRCSDADPN